MDTHAARYILDLDVDKDDILCKDDGLGLDADADEGTVETQYFDENIVTDWCPWSRQRHQVWNHPVHALHHPAQVLHHPAQVLHHPPAHPHGHVQNVGPRPYGCGHQAHHMPPHVIPMPHNQYMLWPPHQHPHQMPQMHHQPQPQQNIWNQPGPVPRLVPHHQKRETGSHMTSRNPQGHASRPLSPTHPDLRIDSARVKEFRDQTNYWHHRSNWGHGAIETPPDDGAFDKENPEMYPHPPTIIAHPPTITAQPKVET